MGSPAGKEISFVAKMLWLFHQGSRCYLCGGEMNPRFNYGPHAPSVDHVSPTRTGQKARFDKNNLGNHAFACVECNCDKGDREPTRCEVLYLFALNRRIGLPETTTARWDTVKGRCPAR